jgi:hypothetical protein
MSNNIRVVVNPYKKTPKQKIVALPAAVRNPYRTTTNRDSGIGQMNVSSFMHVAYIYSSELHLTHLVIYRCYIYNKGT